MLGVIGHPIQHSLSPLMHNRALQDQNLPYGYAPFDVEPALLSAAIQGMKALGFRGWNITIPYKEQVVPWCDELDEDARIMGAVNTIVHKNGKLIGYNTDGRGYVRSLPSAVYQVLDQLDVLIIGAGGAAKAIAVALARHSVHQLTIANRTLQRGEALAQQLAPWINAMSIPFQQVEVEAARYDLIIQTTPCGLYPHVDQLPFPPTHLHSGQWVSDIVYRPLKTAFLQAAEERGCMTIDGVGMLVHQAVLAYELWTGVKPPITTMEAVVRQSLQDEMNRNMRVE